MASDSEDHSDLSSNYSDYSSDEGEQTLEQQPGCDSATPSQPATSNRSPASAPIVPRLGVPSLVLGSRNADRSGAGAMMTARPGTTPPPPAEQPKQPPAVVHLVSFAFTLDTPPSSNADLHAVRTRCVEAFGVAPEELTLFDLRTMGGAGAPAIGVAINNSSMFCRRPMRGYTPAHTGFSLEAMEQLLANNQQLSSAAERSAAALESLQHLVREQHATVGKAQLLAAEKDAETRRLQERVRHLEKEVGALRQQLQRSDMARMQGQLALDELKREFETLMCNIVPSKEATGAAASEAQPSSMDAHDEVHHHDTATSVVAAN